MARIQQTLSSQTSFEKHGRKSKRELFLDHMEQVVPWSELLALVEPHYPKAGNGRQPVGVAIMLRTYPPWRTTVVQPVGSWHGRSLL
jgi:IS5 family transposase